MQLATAVHQSDVCSLKLTLHCAGAKQYAWCDLDILVQKEYVIKVEQFLWYPDGI